MANYNSPACKTHGMSETKLYRAWASMLSRCYNSKTINYKYYGGRGIKVCEEWHKFENFYKDMGDRPDGCTLDRIENSGNYCKENCRWAKIITQRRNRSNNIYITYKGKTQIINDWAKEYNIYPAVIKYRLTKGYELDKIFKKSSYQINLQNREFVL